MTNKNHGKINSSQLQAPSCPMGFVVSHVCLASPTSTGISLDLSWKATSPNRDENKKYLSCHHLARVKSRWHRKKHVIIGFCWKRVFFTYLLGDGSPVSHVFSPVGLWSFAGKVTPRCSMASEVGPRSKQQNKVTTSYNPTPYNPKPEKP